MTRLHEVTMALVPPTQLALCMFALIVIVAFRVAHAAFYGDRR